VPEKGEDMSNWRFKLKISHIWNDEAMPIEEKGKAIARVMRQTFPSYRLDENHNRYDYYLDTIINGFENITGYDDVSPVEEFDKWMGELYNWADQEVFPSSKWPQNKMCWVETTS
jgi:hypothetical protein